VADTDGTSFVVTEVPHTGFTVLYLTLYDAAGNAAFTKTIVTLPSEDILLDHMILSPPVAGKKFIYLQTSGDFQGTDFTSYIKIDTSGSYQTGVNFLDNGGTKSLNIGADANGNFYVAVIVAGLPHMLEYDASNNVVHDVQIQTFTATDARFVAGKWFFNGIASDQTSGGIAWRFYAPSSPDFLAQVKLNYVDNGTTNYTYNATDYCDNNGAVYWGVNVTARSDANPSQSVTNHFLRCYTATGVQVWASKSVPNSISGLCGPGAGGPLWAWGAAGDTNFFFDQFDLYGNRAFTKTGSASILKSMVSDSIGAYLYYRKVNQAVMTIQRVNLNGDVVYSDSFAPINGSIFDAIPVQQVEANGSLYVCGFTPYSGFQAVIKRYVTGVTISSVSGASTAQSGTNYTLKVQLNAPAPSGGIKVDLTSSSAKLLFPNNLATYSIAIPAGSIYANVLLKAGIASANTPVVVKGVQNGV
jgi:hypothetical protein